MSKRTLANWSQQHSWQARVADYDRDLSKGFQIQADDLDPNFDQRDMLLKAAHLALLRVLQSNPVVRTPQDAKALIDAASNVLKSVELLRVNAADRKGSGNGTKQMFEVLAVIEARVRNTEQPQSRTIDGQAIRVTEPALLAPPEVKVGGRLIEIGMLLMRGGARVFLARSLSDHGAPKMPFRIAEHQV